MARDYADPAKRFLGEAENAFSAADFATCVRRSQESLEIASKAVLRRLAIEYPHEHDVSEALEVASERLPDYLRADVDELKSVVAELARVRGPAFYGYELEGIPAGEIFTKEYASGILHKTKSLVESCVRFAMEGSGS